MPLLRNAYLPWAAIAVVACLTACSSSPTEVGTVNIERITAHWSKFTEYERQLSDESQRIAAARESEETRSAQLDALHAKYAALQSEITTDVRQAANKVQQAQGLRLIVTRQFVGYGGRDITDDIEKELGVVETPSPAPTPPASATPSPTAAPSATPTPGSRRPS